MDDARAREIVFAAWHTYAGDEAPLACDAARVPVSTNRVYRLRFAARPNVYAKVSSYGSFVHFRQDHQRIEAWRTLLRGTRFSDFLAPVLRTNDDVYTYHAGDGWVAFYAEVPWNVSLPRVLSDGQIATLAGEMAEFHRASLTAAAELAPTWKSLGSDIALLFDRTSSEAWLAERGFGHAEASYLRDQSNLFLRNADRLGYAKLARIPVLIDWNIGNFSVTEGGDRFALATRWDYDWFRIEPRMLDFYFLSRVVSAVGDRTVFSYGPRTLFEPRFVAFLRHYHALHPISQIELSFLKEAYRFFVLHYVIFAGEHFFQPGVRDHLIGEAVDWYLPEIDRLDFRALSDALACPSAE